MNKNSKNTANSAGNEKSLLEIIHIIYRRKWLIIISVLFTLSVAYVYNLFSAPVYESTVIVKKEMASKNNFSNDLMEIVNMQSQDEVETEMELVKTIEVLSKVAGELNLFVHYDKLVTSRGNTFILNKPAMEYSNLKYQTEQLPFKLPQVVSITLKDYDQSAEYYLKKNYKDSFSIYNAADEQLIQTIKSRITNYIPEKDPLNDFLAVNSDTTESLVDMTLLEFTTPLADINLNWSEIPAGSRFYFSLSGFNKSVDKLNSKVSVGRTGKTNLFTVSVESPTSYSAAKLANVLIDKFRESRIEQQKQSIRYSFNFIDEQLQEMQLKLREAEDNLSGFKASSQITTIDASSQEVVKFLSTLQAENMNAELQLSEYRNKIEDLKKQLEASGYFDQNLLTPQGSGGYSDPFANLLRQISDFELKRLELLQKRTENHPEVIGLDEQINMAKQKLASYNQNTLSAYQILINSLEKKKQDINILISKYESKLGMLPSQENKFARLFREKVVYEKMFTLLLDKREEMRMAELSKLQDIIVVDPAREPLKPVGPKKLFNLLLAFILGSFLGTLAIFIMELKNNKLINLDELEAYFKIPILSILPKYTRTMKNSIDKAVDAKGKFVNLMIDEKSGFKETYRLLKTKLELQFDGRKRIFLITSCEENTGKSTTVANLAIAFAQDLKRVLLIDCDLRKAGLSKLFEVHQEKSGLIDYLTKATQPNIHTRVSKFIDILPTGGIRLDSSNLLSSEKMDELFNVIDISVYDYIIIDTPPVTRVVDTLILGKYFKDAILIVRPDLSLKENVNGGLQDLADARIKVRGIVVNAAEITKSYYYKNRYGYGYGYGYGEDQSSKSTNSMGKLKRKVSKTFSKN